MSESSLFSILHDSLQLQVYDRFNSVPHQQWNAVAKGHGIFLTPRYLESCESSRLPGMEFRYVIAYEGSKPSAVLYLQISNLSDAGLGGVLNLHDYGFLAGALMSKVNSFLFEPSVGSTHLMCCGNLLVSGDHGIAVSDPGIMPRIVAALPALFEELTRRLDTGKKVVAWMVKDFMGERDVQVQSGLEKSCFRLHADPVMAMHLRPEWRSFDDYLNALSSKYRVRAKSALSKLDGITIKSLEINYIHAHEPEIGMLLEQVISKAPVKLVRPVTRYFVQLKQHFGKHYDFRGYFAGDRMVAFTSGLWDKQHYEAHYIGMDYELNRKHSLYQNILYGFIDDAIQNAPGALLSFGRTALEIKSTVGARPVEMGCYLKLTNAIIHKLARPMMGKAGPGDWIPRDPFRNEG